MGAAVHQGLHQAGKACFRLITLSLQASRARLKRRMKTSSAVQRHHNLANAR